MKLIGILLLYNPWDLFELLRVGSSVRPITHTGSVNVRCSAGV
jgi:hypothetical protein